MLLLLLIYVMGIHNYEILVWIELLKVFLKMDIWINCVEMVFDSKFAMVLIAFLCT